MNSTYRNVLFALLCIASMALGIVMATQQFSSPPDLKIAQLLPGSKKLIGVDLESTQQQEIQDKYFLDHWTLVFFGFTSCPDFCPMELQKMTRVLRLAGDTSALQVLFVSVDPERDVKETLRGYLEFFHPHILGARGSNSELAKFAQFFGAAYNRNVILDNKVHEISAGMDMPANTGNLYQVNHSLRIFIINPQGEYIGSFAPPHDAELIWADMKALMD